MSSQVLSQQRTGARAFLSLLRAHAATTARLSARLTAQHGLTINDFEVLIQLARAPDRKLRRVDLAQEVLLTASGITRLLDGLERAGFVAREACSADRRVAYAVLTDAGLAKLQEAAATHFPHVEELFGARYDEDELTSLSSLLGRLSEREAGAAECEVPSLAPRGHGSNRR